MRKGILVLAMCLTGCVGTQLNNGLKPLLGQNIQSATARLGYPDGQRQSMGDTIYVWSTSHNGVLFMPNTNTTYGNVGGTPYSATTTGYAPMGVNFNCTIQLGTDSAGTIKNYRWSGNPGGCASYARSLK